MPEEKKTKKFIAVVSKDECKGCERCVNACPKSVLIIQNNLNVMGYRYSVSTDKACIGCGACFYACPEPGAITIYEESEEV